MSDWWKQWHEIKNSAAGREVVFYGRSEDWIPKALKKVAPACIVDNNRKYSNTKYKDVEVLLPKDGLYAQDEKAYVVITAGIYDGIASELIDNGFIPGKDFSCSPDYRDFKLLDNMREHEKKILVSCSDYNESSKARYSKAGGGLYVYDLLSGDLEKKVSGSFRQLAWRNDLLYAVDYVACEVQVFDSNFELIKSYSLDAPNYCGMAYNKQFDVFIIINAGKDTISIHDGETFALKERIHYSGQDDLGALSEHHLNDVTTDGKYIYVSYFSHSGNWKKGVFDGGVSQFKLDDLSASPNVLVTGLWKPHSPEIIDGELCYLDSMRGRFYHKTQEYSAQFQSFARGLTFDGRYYYIGASEDMYMSERFGHSDNIMLNAGFYMFDLEKKASRFFPMLGNMNIHDLVVL